MSRDWRSWPSRTNNQLLSTSGVVGLAGIGISALGTTVSEPFILGIGVFSVLGAYSYSAFKGLPPKFRAASELVGQIFDVNEFKTIESSLPRLGIVGSSDSGKSTFLTKAVTLEPPEARTPYVYATVVALQTSPPTYIALIDGDGEQLAQQFEIAEKSSFLLVFFDHNYGDNSVASLSKRKDEHDIFMTQMEFHIRRGQKPKRIHAVLNKRDLWEHSKSADELITWFDSRVLGWQNQGLAEVVSKDLHSNKSAGDVAKLIATLQEFSADK